MVGDGMSGDVFKLPVSAKPHVGDVMEDGWIYVGVSATTGEDLYAAHTDAAISMTFQEAVDYAREEEARGFAGARLPTPEELEVNLDKNRDEGYMRGTFNTVGSSGSVYRSSAPDSALDVSVNAYDSPFRPPQWINGIKNVRLPVRLVR